MVTADPQGRVTADPQGRVTAGPQAAGFPTGCWKALRLQTVIARECHQTDNVHSVATLLHPLGCSFQQAGCPLGGVSDHLAEARRPEWRLTPWPAWRQRAATTRGLLRCGDEASFAQWGSWGSTWAPIGEQPVGKTTGKRQADKGFGLIEYFSGQRCAEGITGKCNATTYQGVLEHVLDQPTAPVLVGQDGAKDHPAAALQPVGHAHRGRVFTTRLPSYSPDYPPSERIWWS